MREVMPKMEGESMKVPKLMVKTGPDGMDMIGFETADPKVAEAYNQTIRDILAEREVGGFMQGGKADQRPGEPIATWWEITGDAKSMGDLIQEIESEGKKAIQ